MNSFVNEYRKYKGLLEGALEQMADSDFFRQLSPVDNSIAVILKHISGNLISRFTGFLTSDGEKPWRDRESEFRTGDWSRPRLEDYWQQAWKVLEKEVFILREKDMTRTVTIRGVEFTVAEALIRSLAHFSFHVGQIVYLARHFKGSDWRYLTIPPGGSEAYNQNPDKEKGFPAR